MAQYIVEFEPDCEVQADSAEEAERIARATVRVMIDKVIEWSPEQEEQLKRVNDEAFLQAMALVNDYFRAAGET